MDQWLRTGTCQNLKQNTNSDVLPSSTNYRSENSVQNVEIAQSSVLQRGLKRKYSDEYIKYGFSYIGDEDCPKPKCVVCGVVLSNGCMKPSFLSRHLHTKHMDYKNKDCDFFKRLKEQNNVSILSSYILPANKDNERAVDVSYRISYHIAKCGYSHQIGEKLILPCIKDAVGLMIDQKYIQKINCIPLSNNTVSRRIHDMS